MMEGSPRKFDKYEVRQELSRFYETQSLIRPTAFTGPYPETAASCPISFVFISHSACVLHVPPI